MKSPHNLKLVHLSVLIPSAHLADVLCFCEARKAFNVEVRAFQPNGNGATAGASPSEKSMAQQTWIASRVKSETTIKDLMPKWTEAGFAPGSIYGALARATQKKAIKKVRAGLYRPSATRG